MQRLSSLLVLLGLVAATPASLQAQWSTTSLSSARRGLVATSVGGKALFAGGRVGNTTTNNVDIYDSSLGAPTNSSAWSTATLSVGRASFAAASVGNLALFAGGADSFTTMTAAVDVYDATTGTWSVGQPLSVPRAAVASATIGTRVFFAGGLTVTFAPSAVIDIYDASLGAPSDPHAWSVATLSVARGSMGTATIGNRVIFAGGQDAFGAFDTVEIYDASLGAPTDPAAWSVASLSQARNFPGNPVTVVGSRAYFAGGQTGPTTPLSSVIDVFDDVSGTWTVSSLSNARASFAAVTLGETALFAGGAVASGATADVAVLNGSSAAWALSATLSQARGDLAATTVAGMALFAGGATGSAPSNVVDVYQPIGTPYCSATLNSTGVAAAISASGSTSLVANDLLLSANGLPNTPCMFFHGPTQVQIPFGNGYRCVGGGVVRVPPVASAVNGVAQVAIDLNAAGITTPCVRNFQCWYRDPSAGGAGTNTSDAIEITFVP